MGHDVAPGGDLDLHAQLREDRGHVGDGLLQRQVLAFDKGAVGLVRLHHQQGLGVFGEAVHLFDLEVRPGLDHLLHRAAVDGAQNSLPVLVGNIFRQLHLNLEDLVIAVFRVNDVVLRQANIVGGDVPGLAVHLYEIGRAHGGRCQEIVKRTGCRAIALVADGLVGDDGEVVELGFQAKVVEEVDVDFHGGATGSGE